jgi:hypothetical protein
VIAVGDAFQLPTSDSTAIFGVVLSVRPERDDALIVYDDGRKYGYAPLQSIEYGKARIAALEVRGPEA